MTSVVPITLDFVSYPAGHPLAGGRGVVNVFLIVHPDGPILVDTGVGGGSRFIDRAYAPVRGDLEAVLAGHGVRVAAIRTVVHTHLHFDHIGRNREFPEATIYAQRTEIEAAAEAGYTVDAWLGLDSLTYRALDGEAEIARGVTVIPTPGHTAGHQSVLVETGEGLVAIAGQAAGSAAEFAEVLRTGRPPATDPPEHAEAYVASIARLAGWRPGRVYFSHHEGSWAPA